MNNLNDGWQLFKDFLKKMRGDIDSLERRLQAIERSLRDDSSFVGSAKTTVTDCEGHAQTGYIPYSTALDE